MKNNLDQYDNTVGLEFDLDLLVAELAARGTCRREFATRGTQVFKRVLKFFLVELPCNSNFMLKFHAQLEMNIIFFIIQLLTIVHFQTNNNYYHACYRERIFVIKTSKYLSNRLICYAMVNKLATALCAPSIIEKMYRQFNSGIHPCCDTHYLFLRIGSFEFVTHQRCVTFMPSKCACPVPAGESVSIVSLN